MNTLAIRPTDFKSFTPVIWLIATILLLGTILWCGLLTLVLVSSVANRHGFGTAVGLVVLVFSAIPLGVGYALFKALCDGYRIAYVIAPLVLPIAIGAVVSMLGNTLNGNDSRNLWTELPHYRLIAVAFYLIIIGLCGLLMRSDWDKRSKATAAKQSALLQ